MAVSIEPGDLPQPALRTERLVLRPFVYRDAPRVQALAGDARVAATTLNIPHPYGDGVAETWIASHISDYLAGRSMTCAIARPELGVVGAIGLSVRARHRKADMGYWIGVEYWGRGYATEAAGAIIEFAASHFQLEKITAHHMIENPASGRVMEKLGMVKEGGAARGDDEGRPTSRHRRLRTAPLVHVQVLHYVQPYGGREAALFRAQRDRICCLTRKTESFRERHIRKQSIEAALGHPDHDSDVHAHREQIPCRSVPGRGGRAGSGDLRCSRQPSGA